MGRVLRVVHVIARLNDGGPARVLAELVREGRRLGIDGHILCGRCEADEPDLAPALIAEGLPVTVLPALGRSPKPWQDLLALAAVTTAVKGLRPDLVHTHTAKAGALGRIASRLLSRPCLHSYHGHVLHGYWSAPVNLALSLIERVLGRLATCHTLTSGQVRELRDRHRVGHRWICLPVPVRTTPPRQADWQRQLDPSRPVLGFLGRLAPVKDPELFLAVCALVNRKRPIQALICGDGALAEQVRSLAEAQDFPVMCTGFVPAGEALQPMDCLLMTSRNEGQPLTVIEAAGAAVPVVAPAVGGLKDMVGGPGLRVVQRSAAALAEAVLTSMEQGPSPSWSLHFAESYAPDAVVPRYVRWYRRLSRLSRNR
jgi:glycosyltransferase involved in cell wall biosynthesis